MKTYLPLFFIIFSIIGCKETQKETDIPAVNDEQVEEMAYMSYGSKITAENAISTAELFEKYQTLTDSDTIQVKVKSEILDVCPKKGCWVKMAVGSDTTRVMFKDYGFFLPKNGKGKEVVFEGKVYKSITDVETLRHYAEDAGKSQEEIEKINEPETSYTFIADGALVEEFENPDVEMPAEESASE
ncbi:hypothetical protein JCM19294_589 [Nonlabens tegetincola]|uniref:DUF4920 domain-containing protein n=1 Tax=Nonlabens tegetincola TaxID=323273 RepID=A0A090Q5Q8_9FLAO|nr:DUF4920 domain-containing protein [Nonlabens tegetincola]GAK97083.1 hypothetical protein JCM19294_589 [Nonlabens tegetincola]